jgi:predicted Rossmann fold nucleotide-binding protein DprA/Smf involved in DNA uptake
LLSELGPVSELAARETGDADDGGLFDERQATASDQSPAETAEVVELGGLQKQVFEALGREELSVDELVEKTGLEAGAIQAQLTMLAIKTVVKRVDGQKYARKR